MIFISNAAVHQQERLLKFETSGFYQNEYALLLWTKVQYLACIFLFFFFLEFNNWNACWILESESIYLSLHSGPILGCGSDLWKHHQPDILNHIIDSLNFIHFLWARVTDHCMPDTTFWDHCMPDLSVLLVFSPFGLNLVLVLTTSLEYGQENTVIPLSVIWICKL